MMPKLVAVENPRLTLPVEIMLPRLIKSVPATAVSAPPLSVLKDPRLLRAPPEIFRLPPLEIWREVPVFRARAAMLAAAPIPGWFAAAAIVAESPAAGTA